MVSLAKITSASKYVARIVVSSAYRNRLLARRKDEEVNTLCYHRYQFCDYEEMELVPYDPIPFYMILGLLGEYEMPNVAVDEDVFPPLLGKQYKVVIKVCHGTCLKEKNVILFMVVDADKV
nr:unnamed protein product [Timema bartmani]